MQRQPTQNWQRNKAAQALTKSVHQNTNQGRTSGLQIKPVHDKNHKVERMSSCHGAMLEIQEGVALSLWGAFPTSTYLGFLEATVDLPEVFCEEIFSDWLPVDSDSLSDLDQVRGTGDDTVKCYFIYTCAFLCVSILDCSVHHFPTPSLPVNYSNWRSQTWFIWGCQQCEAV